MGNRVGNVSGGFIGCDGGRPGKRRSGFLPRRSRAVGIRYLVAGEEGVLAAPLVQQTYGTDISGRGGDGAKVAVHHHPGIVEIRLCAGHRIIVLADPDMPGPEDIAPGILDRDDGISVFQRLRSEEGHESRIAGVIGNFCDDIADFRSLVGPERLPQDLCTGNFTYGLCGIAFDGLEGICSA